ncbi:protein of unknown function DUF1156 [Trichodesmium erythraeum IMS101]|uniref:DUF1156 domain-containing protein n=1 Tax=Trichodesmium erythraeum (strain IMS101) TaxID=203124 RepID=Q10WV2_TRIEI
MTNYPKRLIEVDLPIKQISAHARREKSIRHGHISTLHIWWARRPLAACRAVICAALWLDPVDDNCPELFRVEAAKVINGFAKIVDKNLDNHGSTANLKKWQVLAKPKNQLNPEKIEHLNILRYRLLDFIADFANWDNSTHPDYLQTSRKLTEISHYSLGGITDTKPVVFDSFAGGGAIPLEALRVGADAFASDLNPVAVLLNKVVLEYIPKYGQTLADEVRKWGEWIKQEAEKELGEFYPKSAATLKNGDVETPIAYLWARTIVCEGPGCGAEVPLMRSLWLAKKKNRSVALRLIPRQEEKRVDFEIVEQVKGKDVGDGTVKRGSATCPCCGFTTPVASVRKQLQARGGGADDARLFCVVTTREKVKGRFYRLPNERDLEAVRMAGEELARRKLEYGGELSLVPDEPVPVMSGVFNAPIYGHNTWGSLFSSRQALALTTLVRLVKEVGKKLASNEDERLAIAIQTCLALAVDRCTNQFCSLSKWNNSRELIDGVFARQALPMLWDFGETNLVGGSDGYWQGAVSWVLSVIKASLLPDPGQTQQANAASHPLPDDFTQCFFSDPPYYNAVPYADLSDFFYVWLKRTLNKTYPNLFSSETTPKDDEICEMAGWDSKRYPHKNGKWFETQMAKAMAEGCRIISSDGIGIIVFAHKSTAGWEAQLQAMIDAGWKITASWAIDTERGNRPRAQNSAALASSIHLVCRPRNNNNIGDWRDIIQELPQRIQDWMPRLTSEGIVGADAIFACIGPALEIFSRYSSVEKVNGQPVTLGEYLEYLWGTVANEALKQIFSEADTNNLEADARLTVIWLWTLSTGSTESATETESDQDEEDTPASKNQKSTGFALEFDTARKIAQGLGAHLENLTHLVEIKGNKARLLPVQERSHYLIGKVAPTTNTKKRKSKTPKQLSLEGILPEKETEIEVEADIAIAEIGKTVLDRIHQTMLLHKTGRSEAVKRLLVEEGVGKDPRFWNLADALLRVYPQNVEEKRWLEGILARKKGLGF